MADLTDAAHQERARILTAMEAQIAALEIEEPWTGAVARRFGYVLTWIVNEQIETPVLDEQQGEYARIVGYLHARRMHPDFEYETTDGPRKAFDPQPPDDGWVRNVYAGEQGWERFDYHEEAYWMRRKPAEVGEADRD